MSSNGSDSAIEELDSRLHRLKDDQPSVSSSTVRRRSSSNPVTKPGLSLNNFNSIPFPIPESIPNTPGIVSDESHNVFDRTLVAHKEEESITTAPQASSGTLPLPGSTRPQLNKMGSVYDSSTQLLTAPPEAYTGGNQHNYNDNLAISMSLNKVMTLDMEISENQNQPNNTGLEKMSLSNPPLNRYRLLCCCLWTLTLGMSDGVLGALLPTIEAYYGVSYAVVALIWLGNAIGFIIIAFTAHIIDEKLGRHKMAVVSCIGLVIMLAVMASGCKSFPVIVVGFFFGGIGGAMGLSQFNIFLSKFEKGNKYLGWFHGTYGIGAFISPIIATVMVEKGGVKWNFYYFIPLALSVSNVVGIGLSFRGCDSDLAKWESEDADNDPTAIDDPVELKEIGKVETTAEVQIDSHRPVKEKHQFKEALKDYRTWLICSFIFFYQGAEVAMGGWAVTYLLKTRSVNPETIGYVASGYWGGLTLGRFILAPTLPQKFGVRRSNIILLVLIIGFSIVTWLVPNVYVAGVAVAFVGVCIGPIYPMMIVLMTKILPRKIKFCALTLGTAFGSSGGSAVPFAVGMASEFVGTFILFPIVLVCISGVLASWLGQPNIERKGGKGWQRIW